MSIDLDNLEVDPVEVARVLESSPNDVSIVDVREDWELVRGILPGAVHRPLSRFNEFVDSFETGQKYIIYCEHGVRSLDVAAWLQGNKSIDAKSMRGGFSVWTGPVAGEPGA